MWGKILKITLYLLPYIIKAADFIIKRLKRKIPEAMKEKIKKSSEKIDLKIDFTEMSKKVKNVFLRGLVASVEMFDGTIVNYALTELIDLVPEEKKYIVEKYLDAIINEDWKLVCDATADVVNIFIDVPGATEDEEKQALAPALVLLLLYIKNKLNKEV